MAFTVSNRDKVQFSDENFWTVCRSLVCYNEQYPTCHTPHSLVSLCQVQLRLMACGSISFNCTWWAIACSPDLFHWSNRPLLKTVLVTSTQPPLVSDSVALLSTKTRWKRSFRNIFQISTSLEEVCRLQAFSYHASLLWNNLPVDSRKFVSVGAFESKLLVSVLVDLFGQI